MTKSSIVELALSQRLDDLEQAWTAALADPGDVVPYCRTLQLLCERDMTSRALALASSMVESLEAKQRLDDAFSVGMTLVAREAQNDNLAKRMFALIERLFGAEPWFATIAEVAGLGADNVGAASLSSFERMRRYTAGNVVYHRAGWGEGLIEHFDAHRRELVVQFAGGRRQEVPLQTAIDSMTSLDRDDYRAMLLTQPDALKQLAADDPAALIRKVARVFRGRVNSAEVKGALSPAVVPTEKWASFWKRAKAAAAVDPYLQVEGSTTRPVFVLRQKPLSLVEEIGARLKHCDGIGEEVALLRENLERTQDPAMQQAILDLAQERIEAAARSGKAPHAHVLDGILLLEKHDRATSTPAATELRAMLLGDGDDLQPESFDQLATQDAREHAVRLVPEALGEGWASRVASKLTRFPAGVIEPMFQVFVEHREAAVLAPLWDEVAPYPQRHPVATYLLARLCADGAFAEATGAPDRKTVVRVVLHLLRMIATERRKDPQMTRLQTRLVSLLAGRRNFLAQVLQDIDREPLATLLGICDRGGADFPPEITDLVLRTVAKKYPELTAKPDRPFWEDRDAIYVTRAGLATKREEYRRLVEELIPANSRAIGAAAEQGDLSENSEWEAAMEEQRNLTTRASITDQELRRAKLIEEQVLPEELVSPGTRVTYRVATTGETRTVSILGPWDTTTPDILNYLAPAAQPLLGCTVGETARLPTERGDREVRVETIERLF